MRSQSTLFRQLEATAYFNLALPTIQLTVNQLLLVNLEETHSFKYCFVLWLILKLIDTNDPPDNRILFNYDDKVLR